MRYYELYYTFKLILISKNDIAYFISKDYNKNFNLPITQ